MVNVRVMELETCSEKSRPALVFILVLTIQPDEVKMGPESQALIQFMLQAVEAGMPPHQVADIAFQAIRDETFYILTHPETKEAIRVRMEDMLQERNPTFIPVLP